MDPEAGFGAALNPASNEDFVRLEGCSFSSEDNDEHELSDPTSSIKYFTRRAFRLNTHNPFNPPKRHHDITTSAASWKGISYLEHLLHCTEYSVATLLHTMLHTITCKKYNPIP